jgi:carboxymethylenebutenolidase
MSTTTTPIRIPTPDGQADGYAVHPSAPGRYPAVLFYMDAIGLRPALLELARGLAERGYYVLLPNVFYRAGQAPVIDYQTLISGEDAQAEPVRQRMFALIGELTPETVARDAQAYLAFLDAQPQVKPGPLAVTGYCMGGSLALRAAAQFPERVVAAASFHGGRLATEAPSSPHLLAERIKAELYIGHAKDDPSCPAEQVERLEAALDAAGVRHQTEIYEAKHGWTMPDLPWAHHAEAAQKAWGRLYALLDRTLK